MSLGHANMATCTRYAAFSTITIIIWLVGLYGATSEQEREYCAREGFTASCPGDQVIIMTNATYGRMQLGRCIQDDYQLGCSADALGIMHTLCSGRTQCTIPTIVSAFIDLHPCGEMFGYLQASYKCQSVVGADVSECGPGISTTVPLPSGTFANVITGNTGCGNIDHPWVIQAASTQQITLSLTSLTPTEGTQRTGTCEVYAKVKELTTGGEFRVCGADSLGDSSETHVYTSVGNKIQVILQPPAKTGDKFFLIHYEVIGCPEPTYPDDMWIRRASDHVTLGCYSSRLSWRLECQNNTWHGEVGNCSSVAKTPGGHYIPEIATPVPAIDQREPQDNIVSDEIGLLLAIAGGVFLSVLLLAVGLLFDKSREAAQPNPAVSHVTRHPGTSPGYSTNTSLRKPVYNTTTINGHRTVPRKTNSPGNLPNGNSTCPVTTRPTQVRDSIADRSSIATGYYDVPHYYELDPDYEDGGQNAFVSNGEKNVLIDI